MTLLDKCSQVIPGASRRIVGSHAKKAWICASRCAGLLKFRRFDGAVRSSCNATVVDPSSLASACVSFSISTDLSLLVFGLLLQFPDPGQRLRVMHPHSLLCLVRFPIQIGSGFPSSCHGFFDLITVFFHDGQFRFISPLREM